MPSALRTARAVTPAARSPSAIYLGMDVHKDSITIAVLPESASAPMKVERLSSEFIKLKSAVPCRYRGPANG